LAKFEFPIHGLPQDRLHHSSIRKPFQTASDGRLYRPSIWVRIAGVHRPRPPRWYQAQLDTGADCCVFAQWIADELGVARPADAHEEPLRTGAGRVTAWFSEVELHLGMPAESYEFDWTAPVGFVRDDVLPPTFRSGIFGIGGGLERFLSTFLVLSPDGAEAPVVRIYTPPP
jgi:hypothetical protein